MRRAYAEAIAAAVPILQLRRCHAHRVAIAERRRGRIR